VPGINPRDKLFEIKTTPLLANQNNARSKTPNSNLNRQITPANIVTAIKNLDISRMTS
jgi:hypothetical protein